MTTPSSAPSPTTGLPTIEIPEVRPLPDSLRVEPWEDPVIANLGHDPRSAYVERYWLGVLGPSTTWLLRRLAQEFDSHPEGFDLALQDTARAIGLGMRGGRQSPFLRSIERACQFGLARRIDDATLLARRHIPPVTQGQLKRLPEWLQQAHAASQEAALHDNAGPEPGDTELKARRLALTLLEIGEGVDAAERQLGAWRFDPQVTHKALQWAHRRHLNAQSAAAGSPGPEAA